MEDSYLLDKQPTVCITDTEVGAVIHYTTSNKLYIVADKRGQGKTESRLLCSTTQTYRSSVNNFKVVEVIKGTGALSEETAIEIEVLINLAKFKGEKRNADFLKLYYQAMNGNII